MSAEIERNFTYHTPKPGQPEQYQRLREKAKELALLIEAECPHSRERSLAITKLEEAVFWANASIARHDPNKSLADRIENMITKPDSYHPGKPATVADIATDRLTIG